MPFMKKLLYIFILLAFSFQVSASFDDEAYIQEQIEYFKSAPSVYDLENIKDKKTRYCEAVFLVAYMRREFTEEENNKCRNLFARRIEAEYYYKEYVLKQREIY
ncbi:MAG: hypothetical protein LBF15_03995 [Candidatus Peribacteria bacterium]|jgi:hypothetical protein|nr:hypothetical protein [Candidatus Peribacteria bacterium]